MTPVTLPVVGGSDRNRRYWKNKRNRGLCGEFGCNAASGDDFRCHRCKAAHAADERARYRRRKRKKAAREAA